MATKAKPTTRDIAMGLAAIHQAADACYKALKEDPGCTDPDRAMVPFEDLDGATHRLLVSLGLASDEKEPERTDLVSLAEVRDALVLELRRKAANTPIPSSPTREGQADGLEQAANHVYESLSNWPSNQTDREQCRCSDVHRGQRQPSAVEIDRNACAACGGLLWDPNQTDHPQEQGGDATVPAEQRNVSGRPIAEGASGGAGAPSETSDYERLVSEEALILEATEAICERMEQDSGLTRKTLAKRLGKSKGFVTQILAGDRNMTLRTLARLAAALDCRAEVKLTPIPGPPGDKSQGSSSEEAADLDEALTLLTKRRLAIVEHAEQLSEFDAWLSFRPEFAEVLTAFRSAFGIDTAFKSEERR